MTNNQAHKGALLKQTREAKGIALETIHEVTKIPMDALRAIEEGYNVRILAPFYYKGFVKMYAQYLGLPPESVEEEEVKPPLKPLQPAPSVPAAYPPPIKRSVVEPKPGIATKNFAAEKNTLKEKFAHWFSRRQQQQIVAVIGAIILLFIAVKVLGFIKISRNFFNVIK